MSLSAKDLQQHRQSGDGGVTSINLDILPSSSRHTHIQDVQRSTSMSVLQRQTSQVFHVKPKRAGRILIVTLLAIGVIVSRSAHTLLSQAMKKHLLPASYGVLRLPLYITFVEVASFPIPLAVWLYMCWKTHGCIKIDNWRYRMKMYLVIAVLDSAATALASISLSILPAAAYTIIKSSTVVFSVVFSRLLTKKRYNWFHYAGAAMVVISVVIVSAIELGSEKKGLNSNSSSATAEALLAILVCLGGSICVGLLGVVGYSMFVNQNVKGDFVMICEQNAMQSTLMFILLLPILASNEAAGWLEVFADVSESGRTSTMVAYSLGLFFARPLTLFSCIGVMAFASASLVGTLGGPRRLLVIILAFIIFNESASAPKLVSVACLCVALGIYAYGGHRLQLEKEKEENKTQPKVARGSV